MGSRAAPGAGEGRGPAHRSRGRGRPSTRGPPAARPGGLRRLFLHTPPSPPPPVNSCGGASWRAAPPLRAPGLLSPLPHAGSGRGSREAPFIHLRGVRFPGRVGSASLTTSWAVECGSLDTAGVGRLPWFQGHEKRLECGQFKPGVCREAIAKDQSRP